MSTLPSYKVQEQKIFDAYFKNEIQPLDSNFCFCGTLCDNSNEWYRYDVSSIHGKEHNDYMGYKGFDFVRMEDALLNAIHHEPEDGDVYEDEIFRGMVASLEVLKSIHQEHGQIIDEPVSLTKRVLSV